MHTAGRFKDLTGQRFGMLTVLSQEPSKIVPNGSRARWLCRCECGQDTVKESQQLKGKKPNCGCQDRAWVRHHGHSYGPDGKRSPTYRSWQSMIARCTQPSNPAFDYYDSLGIVVWDGWRSFDRFLTDMGERPPNTTLDRIDNEGNYEPGNCRWATKVGQANNRRTNLRFTYRGTSYTLAELARATGQSKDTLRVRLVRPGGWNVAEAVETPTIPPHMRRARR